MRWILAGYFGLTLINISVAATLDLEVTQRPRYYGMRTGHSVRIYCLPSDQTHLSGVQWHKAAVYNVDVADRKPLTSTDRIQMHLKETKSFLFIGNLRKEDSGVYFCRINNTWGPGTALEVARPVNTAQATYRTNMKDGLIILQGLLLAGCIAAILLRNRTLLEKRDSIYEEPDTDHIYEGLAIETCSGGDLYEELCVYEDADGAEAPWQ